ncbi:pss1 [Symbiodinium sp. CCMP2592]|nr:pss1 [Symbiodinium sp. CCMP2592]
MAEWSGLTPAFLTSGRNAKSDFPVDFEAYFRDDVAVCTQFDFPSVKKIIEPWQPPHMNTLLHTRKTCMQFAGEKYMLGCVAPADDTELGLTTFRARRQSPEQPSLSHVSEDWYEAAWSQLPQGACFVDAGTGELSSLNLLCEHGGHQAALKEVVALCLERAHKTEAACWQFGGVKGLFDNATARVWMWRFDASQHQTTGQIGQLAMSWRASADLSDLQSFLGQADDSRV